MKESDIRLLMEISPDREIRPGWQRGVEIQRTRTIKAGSILYCSSYPVWDTTTRRDAQNMLTKARERKGTTDAQRKLNARKAEEKMVQLINANFGAGDHLVTCTYAQGKDRVGVERLEREQAVIGEAEALVAAGKVPTAEAVVGQVALDPRHEDSDER